MKNQRLKISGGGVKLSTPIDLKTIENEVASLSGRASSTPISMEALWNEVQNLKSTMKQWEIVTLNRAGSTNEYYYPFDSKYSEYNFIVLIGKMTRSVYESGSGTSIYHYQRNYNSNSTFDNKSNITYSWSKSGNTIKGNYSYEQSSETITVLFYK